MFRKLIVFDLDRTLIDPRYVPVTRHSNHRLFSGATILVNGFVPMYIYLRPYVKITLQICRGDTSMSVALFSAAEKDYVYNVLEAALFPNLDKDFYFDAIYTKEDLDSNGIKRMDKLKNDLQADQIMLVDDVQSQCIEGAQAHGAFWYCIKPFNANDEAADKDNELLAMMKMPFFYFYYRQDDFFGSSGASIVPQ